MLPEERLNDLAAREIDALEAEGIRLTAAEVVKLNALGWAIETPCARRELSRGVPVMLCEGVYLWPLTMRADDWQNRVGENLSPSKRDLISHPFLSFSLPLVALGYAMANAYSDGGELEIDGAEASRAVIKWALSLHCTSDALKDAIAEVIAQQDAPTLPLNEDGAKMSNGEFSAFMASKCDGTPEFWERRCSIGYACAVLSTIVKQAAADGKPLSNDPKIMATRAFWLEADRIRNERGSKCLSA